MLNELLRTRRYQALVGAAIIIVFTVGTVALLRTSGEPNTPVNEITDGLEVPAPDDGALSVTVDGHTVQIPQLAGVRHTDAQTVQRTFELAKAVEVPAHSTRLQLASQRSRHYTVAAVAQRSGTTATVTGTGPDVTIRTGPGRYLVSVLGDAGGTWQFVLVHH